MGGLVCMERAIGVPAIERLVDQTSCCLTVGRMAPSDERRTESRNWSTTPETGGCNGQSQHSQASLAWRWDGGRSVCPSAANQTPNHYREYEWISDH